MKKLLIGLLSLSLVFSFSNVNACETCGCQDKKEIVESKADATSGATKCCKSKCAKSKSKCCKAKSGKYNKASKSYSSGSNSGFNFSNKSSCSKAAKKCGEGCAKACCAKEEPSDDDNNDSDE
ncbi:MAG: hypothetical protein VYD71_04085 [Bacteroidota bacterium]|nr:hypothetical protein [Bacteroidota bacterium]